MTGATTLPSPRFLSIDEALTLHETAVLQHGGATGLRDRGTLDSALAQARQAFGGAFVHEFPFGMAAAYVFHISKNHPFVDGNKRVAFSAIPAIAHAWGGAADARTGGDAASAAILEQHAILLTALFRIAEQQGYEW